MSYFIYHVDCIPKPVENRHPRYARYGMWGLFVSGIERETGIPPTNVMDVAGMGLTGDKLLAIFATISAPDYVQTGAEGQLSESQGRYLRDMLFPRTSEDI
jgi:hypothetical protein